MSISRPGRYPAGRHLRGGTALHKLVLAPPSRYSEDIEQVEAGPIGAVLDRLRTHLDPWLGKPTWDQAASSVTLLKIEINTREHFAVYSYRTRRLAVESRWFAEGADVRTFHLDELLGTKLRALYQRRRGRDLFDLWDASRRGEVNPVRVIEAYGSHGRSSSVIWPRRLATGSSSRK